MRMRIRREKIMAWLGITFAIFLSLASAPTSARAVQCPPGVFPAVNPASLTDPQAGLTVDFISGIMDANNVKKYVNVLPNPLTPGFIYSSAGTQGAEPWYTVSQRQITQTSGLIYQNPLNPADPNNGCTAPPATFWTYGDARDDGLGGVAPTAPHSNPGPTFEVTANTPVRVTWTNELPATHPVSVDPTLDCGPMASGCWPYNRTVVHVHGAHVADDSDGQPDAWFSANFLDTGHTWKPNSHYGPTGTYRYENSQEAATLWYHDHAMGQTHINAYAGLAGFFIVRDANEQALQAPTINPAAPAVLPQYPYETAIVIQDKVFSTNGQLLTPEKPIQDFNALLTNAACDPLLPTTAVPPATVSPYACAAANLAGGVGTILLPTTPCDPLAAIGTVYACPTAKFSADPLRPGALVADPAGTLTAPSITPEFFGNIVLVNGQAWPKLDVEPRVYRVRMLNGSDSRTYILRLMVKNLTTGALTPAPAGLDLWQVGTEQGLLNVPVKPMTNDPSIAAPPALPPFPQTNAIVLMPGERVDMLINFKKAVAGSTIVLQNIGPDGPYTGEYPPSALNAQLPTALTPEIMAFNVITPLNTKVADTLDPTLIGTTGKRGLRPAPIVPLVDTAGTTPKKLYLAERVGSYGRLALTINGKDYMQTINELTRLNDTETWEIYNLTPDAHPMHLHLVAFQVINRQSLIDPVTLLPYAPPMVLPNLNTPVDPLTVGLDPAAAATLAPAPNELNAWKDTIYMPPGTVTRVRAKFDIPGLYVYHCHILSHEENDMMRPYVVTTPATQVNLTSSTPGNSQLSSTLTPVTFTAAAQTGLAAYPETNGFEYMFSVTPPAGVAVTQPDNLTMMAPGTTPGYSLVRNATWTPPATSGTYVVTVKAKPIGASTSFSNVVTGTLSFTVAGPEIAGVTSTTSAGTYRSGASVNVTLAFNQKISSTKGLTITLNTGATISTGKLSNVSGYSGTYTVAAGHNTPAGQYLDVTAITGTVTDAAGNTVNALTIPSGTNLSGNSKITIDTTPPVLTVTDPTSTLVNAATQTVAGIASDQNGIQSLKVNGSSTSIGSGGAFITTVSLVSGMNNISVTATDPAGNQTVVVRNITLDTVKPVTTVTPAGGTYSGSVSVTLSVNKAGSTIYYSTDGSSPTTASAVYSGPIVLAASATTTYTVQYFAVDPAGNNESVKSVSFTVHVSDLTASVKINNGSALTKSAAVTLTLSATDPLGVTSMQTACDGINFSAAEPYNVTRACTLPGSDGVKTVAVKFIDSIGTVYAPVTAQITLDLTAPTLTVTNPASTLVNTPTVTVTGTVSDKNGIQSVTVNGAATAAGAGGSFSKDVTLAGGANTITVIATDNAGNQVTKVRSITLDTVLPVTTVSPAPGTYTGSVTVSLTSSKVGSTIYYTTNGTTPTTGSPVYTGTIALSAAATTTYTVLYFSADQAGNIEAVNTADFTVHVADLTAGIRINNGAQLTNSTSVTLNLAAADPTGVPNMQVACNGTTFGATEPFAASKACTLPPGDGIKTVAIKFIDGVGTVYAPVTAQITLDTTPPVASATPGTGVYAGAVSVELVSSEPATMYYTTDGSTPTTASSVYMAPIQLGSPATAVLPLTFMAVDQAGNASAVQTLNYTIHQPDLSATMKINDGATLTTSPSVTLSLSAADPTGVSEMQVACDGVIYAAAEPYAMTRTCALSGGDGLKTILARFRDGLGNWYPSINAQITLDTTTPVTSVSPAAGTYSNSVSVVLNASEASTIYYTTDGTDPVIGATPGPAVYSGPLTFSPAATTNITVKYLAVDRAGNAEAIKRTAYTVHVNDMVASILINNGAPYTATAYTTLTLAATDPATVTEMQFSNDGVSYTPFEPYATTRAWSLNGGDGIKTVYVRFKDGTGTVYAPYSAEITLSAAAATMPIGDLNGDTVVNLADALRALQISVGLFQPTVSERVRGDVAPLAAGKPNPDGVIDSGDVLVILKRVLALTTW